MGVNNDEPVVNRGNAPLPPTPEIKPPVYPPPCDLGPVPISFVTIGTDKTEGACVRIPDFRARVGTIEDGVWRDVVHVIARRYYAIN